MTHEPREKFFGRTVDEVIAGHLGELESDGVAFGEIIGQGRDDFEISGDELIAFVRRCLTAMLEAGAKPVIGGGTRYQWIEQTQYGSSVREIVDDVMAEWRAEGDPDHGGLWFAKPHLF